MVPVTIVLLAVLPLLWIWLLFRMRKPHYSIEKSAVPDAAFMFEFVRDLLLAEKTVSQVPRGDYHFEENYNRYLKCIDDPQTFNTLDEARRAMYIRWAGTDEDYELHCALKEAWTNALNEGPVSVKVTAWLHFGYMIWRAGMIGAPYEKFVKFLNRFAPVATFFDVYLIAVQEGLSIKECVEKYPWLNLLENQKHPMKAVSVCPAYKFLKEFPIPKDKFNFKVYWYPGVSAISTTENPEERAKRLAILQRPITQSGHFQVLSHAVFLFLVYAFYTRTEFLRGLLSITPMIGFLFVSWKSYFLMNRKPPTPEPEPLWQTIIGFLIALFGQHNFLVASTFFAIGAYHYSTSPEAALYWFLFWLTFEVSSQLVIDNTDSVLLKYPVMTKLLPLVYANCFLILKMVANVEMYYSFLVWNMLTLWHFYIDDKLLSRSLFMGAGFWLTMLSQPTTPCIQAM